MAFLGLTGMHSGDTCMCVNEFFLFIQEAVCGSGVAFDHLFLSPLMLVCSLHMFYMLI